MFSAVASVGRLSLFESYMRNVLGFKGKFVQFIEAPVLLVAEYEGFLRPSWVEAPVDMI